MRKEHLRTCVEKKGRSESKSDVTCVEAVEAAAEAEDGGVNGGGAASVGLFGSEARQLAVAQWRL